MSRKIDTKIQYDRSQLLEMGKQMTQTNAIHNVPQGATIPQEIRTNQVQKGLLIFEDRLS